MTETGQQMRNLLTKFELKPDELFNEFDLFTLEMMVNGCDMLDGMLRCELQILTSVYVKAIVKDDLVMLAENLRIIEGIIKLKELQFENFCMN